MAVPDFAQHVTAQSFAAGARAHALSFSSAAKAVPPAQASAGETSDFSFDDLLDIVNPLQHIPVVSTLYRAITGDTEKPVAEIAGGALYGGVMGLATSLADVAFERLTGKNFGDTVLALFQGDDSSPTETASTNKAPAPASVAPAQTVTPDATALLAAVNAKGTNPDLTQRALFAYQRSMGLNATLPAVATE